MALTCEVGGLFAAFAGAIINNNCTMSSVLTVGVISPPIASGLMLNGYGTTKITLGNNVAITGNVAMPGYLFCAGFVNSVGTTITSTGQVNFTSSMSAFGVYAITFASAHPLGANYIISVTGQGGTALVRGATTTSTSFGVVTYTVGVATAVSYNFYFMVLAS